MKASSIVLTVALAAAGCATPNQQGGSPWVAASNELSPDLPAAPATDYTYELLNAKQTGLVQVFDDGNSTFLKFEEQAPAGLMIFDENGKPVAFSVSGAAVMVGTVRTGFLIRTPTQSSYAQAKSPGRTAQIETYEGGPTVTATPLPADLAAVRAEVLFAQHRLAGLSAELEMAARGEEAPPLTEIHGEIQEIRTRLDGLIATLVRVHFTSGSSRLTLSQTARETLIEDAQAAEKVRIEGGADALGSTDGNSHLALNRARQVRRVLVGAGVAPEKFEIRAASGEYVASNSTLEGRAQNRRVDVIFVPKKPVAGEPAIKTGVVTEAEARKTLTAGR